ncbi:unnamed protein product [Dicrocoelium dendriticum]|nr:unnamed protein product [Dicrocoelium dendriticum]
MVTETWLSTEIADAEIALPGMSSLRKDRPSRGGGVLLYYRSDLHVEIIDDSEANINDSLWCRMHLRRGDVCLLAIVYRPPMSTLEMDQGLAAAMKRVLTRPHSHVLLVGDFNLHALEVPASPSEQFKADLQELITDVPLYNNVTSPTRFRTGDTPSVLDLVLTNEELMIDTVTIATPLGRSDHATLHFRYICYSEYVRENDEETYMVTHYDILSNLVQDTNWSFLTENPPDEAWMVFVTKFTELVANASERKAFRPKQVDSFLRSRTRKSMALRDSAWHAYKVCPSNLTWGVYTTQRNHCVKLIREDKLQHQQNLAAKFSKNPKLLYRHINKLRRVQRGIPVLRATDGHAQTAQDAANVFRQHFLHTFRSEPSLHPILTELSPFPGLHNVSFTATNVLKTLMSLRVHSSPGVDDIKPKALKAAALNIAEPLARFFQRCLDEMLIPTMWKHGLVTPIYKSGNRAEPSNYRPITLLPVLSKVMERIIAEALMGYLENNNIIVPQQHGFRRNRSCTTNLLLARASWTESADARFGVDVVYLDFSKAFDRLDHRILLHKLRGYGIGDPVLGWIANFLTQRQLNVRVRSSMSDPIDVQCGVPQGSVLGPRLFLTFINDLASVLQSNFLLFADDVKIWHDIRTEDDHTTLQSDLDRAYTWSSENMLHFNVAKCKVVSLRHQLIHEYLLGDQPLQHASQECDLGVIVQDDLGCSRQAEKASKRASQHLGLLRRAFGNFEPSVFPQMLSAYVRPHVEYAIQAWRPWRKRDISALEAPQRRATKLVRGLFHIPYQRRLQSLGLYSGEYRRHRGDLIMVYLILMNPNHPCRSLLQLSQNTNLRGHQLKLATHYSRLDCRRNSFSLRVSRAWNALPTHVVLAPTLALFKKRLDDTLSNLHYLA